MPRQPCPVCGRHFKGNLHDHLNKAVRGSGGVTRCEWNLNSWRVVNIPPRLRAAGWVRADAPAARILAPVGKTHPHIAQKMASGDTHTRVLMSAMQPENDLMVWWCRPWAKAIAMVSKLSMKRRHQLVVELDGKTELHTVIEAAYRIGGAEAVTGLLGDALPLQCSISSALGRCVRSVGHDGQHSY